MTRSPAVDIHAHFVPEGYLGMLGNPFDTAVAAARLIFGGVLDRVPALRVCPPHAGGALPYLLGRNALGLLGLE